MAGRVVAGPHVRASCARHLRDLKEGPKRGLRWDPVRADRILRFFPTVLRLNGGEHEGKPFHLAPWETFVVGSLFGWVGADGHRRFRVAFVETGKGSGKSPVAAGIGHYMLLADGEPRAEVYAAATKKDQAMVLFRDAVAMVDQSPALSKRLVKSGGNPVWNLADLGSGSFFRPISSEDDGQSGPRPHCALLDEIHEHRTDVVVEMMRAGFKGRRQPLMFMITNSGVDRQSVCYRYHEYGLRVAAGDLEDDAFFAYICGLDEGDDPFTDPVDKKLGYPKSWAKANPSIGVTFQPSYLGQQVREARGMPAKESLVRRLNFCEWVDALNPWIDGDLWRACEREAIEGVDAPGGLLGLDLAEKRDLAAAAQVVKGEDGVFRATLRFWTPKETIEERERADRVPYSAWVRAGFLRAVPGRSMDFEYIVRDLAGWLTTAGALAFDQWHMDRFLLAMQRVGVESWIWDPPKTTSGRGLRLMRHGQGWGGGAVELDPRGNPLPRKSLWMPQSIGALEDAVVTGKLEVERNPVLTWNSASAVLQRDPAGNPKWEKRKSTGRIDGIVALSMAVGLAAEPVTREPAYDILFLGGR